VRIRDQLADYARSARALTQPLASRLTEFADRTFPNLNGYRDTRVPDVYLHELPVTLPPTTSPYGDNWDMLWIGHCGQRFVFDEKSKSARGRVVHLNDETVPQHQYLWTVSSQDDLKMQYPNHTRVAHHSQDGICSLGYALTRNGARQLLHDVGLRDVKAPLDIALREFCEGTAGRSGPHTCLSSQPSFFHHHRPAGLKKAESDISDHGEGYQEKPRSDMIRWSVRMNADVLMRGGTDFNDQFPDV
jgi:hypothetical protein